MRGQSRKSSDASSLAGSDAVVDNDDDDDDDDVARKAVLTASHVRPDVDGDDNNNGRGIGLKSLRRRLSFEMSFELWIQPD